MRMQVESKKNHKIPVTVLTLLSVLCAVAQRWVSASQILFFTDVRLLLISFIPHVLLLLSLYLVCSERVSDVLIAVAYIFCGVAFLNTGITILRYLANGGSVSVFSQAIKLIACVIVIIYFVKGTIGAFRGIKYNKQDILSAPLICVAAEVIVFIAYLLELLVLTALSEKELPSITNADAIIVILSLVGKITFYIALISFGNRKVGLTYNADCGYLMSPEEQELFNLEKVFNDGEITEMEYLTRRQSLIEKIKNK